MNSIFVSDALATFHLRKYLPITMSSALKMTSCRCFIFSRLLGPNNLN